MADDHLRAGGACECLSCEQAAGRRMVWVVTFKDLHSGRIIELQGGSKEHGRPDVEIGRRYALTVTVTNLDDTAWSAKA